MIAYSGSDMRADYELLRRAEAPVESRVEREALARSAPVTRVEQKVATVMFVDVQGSMDLCRRIDLETWWSAIAQAFELMCASVYESGGWVASFTGDGINAVFEPGAGRECHARRACAAALSVRDAIRTAAVELHGEADIELLIRIGLNSGEVMTGIVGDRHKRYYTANGYAVGLAKRIEGLAPPDRIYLSEHTASLVRQAVRVLDRGMFEVKGAANAVHVFELAGSGDRPALRTPAELNRLTPRSDRRQPRVKELR